MKRILCGMVAVMFALTAPIASAGALHHAPNKMISTPTKAAVESKAVPASPPLPSSVIDEDWWTRMQRGLAAGEYHASQNQQGLQAPNRAHNLRTYFGSEGIKVHDRTAKGSPELTSLSLIGMGRGAALTPVAAGVVTHSGVRVEIRRTGVVEWYVNSPQGLEQGFNLETRPPGAGPLALDLKVEGARSSLAGKSVVLTTEAGRRLHYGKLIALDAAGRTLESRLEAPGPHRVRLVIDDAGAVYPLVIDPLLTALPDALLESNQPDPVGFKPAAFGGGVSGAGDVNGDGFADVIVGAPGWDGGDPHEGAAFIFLGSAAGIVGSDPLTAQAHIESNQFGAQLGTISGSQAGDVNGDGFDDIIVGAHFYRSTLPGTALAVDGAAFVFLGSPAGIVGSDPLTAHAWIEANQLGSDLGLSVSGAGDINGDGFDDILVAAPRQGIPFPPNIPPNDASGNGGAVLVFMGSPAGITGTGFTDADQVLLPYPPGSPVASGGFMGVGVSAAGDVNGDGFADIIMYSAGEAVVFLGSAAGIVGDHLAAAHARITTGQTGTGLTSVSGAGDVNGDGFSDIIVGDPFFAIRNSTTQEGAAFVFLGSAAGITATNTTEAQASFFGNLLAEWVGLSVSGVGDVDGDGFDDVAIGARVYPGSLNSEGVAHVFRGSAAGIVGNSLSDAYARLGSNQSGAAVLGNQTAFGISGAGDVNGDGFADVIMGAGFYDNGQENEGAAFIFQGGPRPINPNQPPVSNAGADQSHVDLNNDGFETVTLDGTASFDPDGAIVSYEWREGETVLGTGPVLTTSLTTIGLHTVVLTVTDNAGVTRGDPVSVFVDLVETAFAAGDDFASGGFTGGFTIGQWAGPWSVTGDVQVGNFGTFPTMPQVRFAGPGASLSRSIIMPAGSTGIDMTFWAKASLFGPADQVLVKVSSDGGASFTTIDTITSAGSDDTYHAHILNHSWGPLAAVNVVIAFETNLSTGLFFIDDVIVTALLGAGANQNPIANAGPDITVTDADGNGSERVLLQDARSFDPDGRIIFYHWREGTTLLGTGFFLPTVFNVGGHTVTLTVTDGKGLTASDTMIVTVNGAGPNQPPVANAGPDQTVTDADNNGSEAVTVDAVASSDPDGFIASYQWSEGLAPLGTTARLTTVLNVGAHVLTLRVTDNSGAAASDTVVVTVNAAGPNQPPVANAGPDQTVTDADNNGSEAVTVDAVASFDPDGFIASYQWSEGPVVLGTSAQLTTVLDVGDYVLTLTVTDNSGASASDAVAVSVAAFSPPPPPPPTSGLAADGFESGGFTGGTGNWVGGWSTSGARMRTNKDGPHSGSRHVRLRKSGAFLARTINLLGASGVRLTFWGKPTQLGGADQLLVKVSVDGGPFTTVQTITSAAPDDTYGFYDIDLSGFSMTSKVRIEFDGNLNNGEFFIDDVAVAGSLGPAPNQPPVANAGPDQTVNDADGTGAEIVTLDGSASSDPDGAIDLYEWKEGVTVLGTAAIITPAFAVGTHTVTLTVTDSGGATATGTVVVTVNANQPPVANTGPDQTVNDADGTGVETVTLDGSASTDPDGGTVSYEWKEGAAVLGATAVITPSFVVGVHAVTLTVTDSGGATSNATVSVTITNTPPPNQPPVANVGPDQTVSDAGGNGVVIVTLDGSASSDPDGGTVSYEWKEGAAVLGATAVITPTFAVGPHTVTLTVTDSGGAASSGAVTVTVTDAPQPPSGAVSIIGPASVSRGDDVTFVVTVSNAGTSTLTGVELSFNVSSNRIIKSLSPGSRVVVADVPPGGSVSQTWTGQADKEGAATLTAEAFSGGVSVFTSTQPFTVFK